MERKGLGLEGLPVSGISESWVLYLESGDGYPPAAERYWDKSVFVGAGEMTQ